MLMFQGLLLTGVAFALAFATLPADAEPAAPAGVREVSDRELDNLVAFARLYGFVRYFHPSDQAQHVEWMGFAVRGFQVVADARSPEQLARRLEALFRPIAPTVQIFALDHPPAPHPALTTPGPQVTCWLRCGTGEGSKTYEATRPILPAAEGLAPGGFPPPVAAYESDLGGGVGCRVPVTLYAQDGKTLPAVPVPAPAPLVEKPAESSRRLAIAASAWNVLQHFYPYHELNRTEWRNHLRGLLRESATAPDEDAFYGVLERLMAQLEDGHGNVYRYKKLADQGPGLRWAWVEDRLVVTRVAPALEGRLRPGDEIVAIDGVEAEKRIEEVEQRISGATPQWIRFRALHRLLYGPANSELKLTKRTWWGTEAVTLTRTFEQAEGAVQRPELAAIAEVDPGVYYVSIGRVTDAQFEAALPRLAQAKGVVLDLREYPDASRINFWTTVMPRLTTRALQSIRFHTPLAIYPDRQSPSWIEGAWTVEPAAPHIGAKLAFLADAGSISQMELWLDIVRHHQLGAIVGEPTAGTDGEIDYQTFGAYHFVWTGMKVLKHDGGRSHGIGIEPDIRVKRTLDAVREGRDEVLEAAVRAVGP